jgi:TatD DNase family protein
VIDTHCHLTFPDFAGRTDEIMERARAAGVVGAITISTSSADCADALAMARSHERIWCSSGVHPLYADASAKGHKGATGEHDWDLLERCARDEKCVAWGELGLDNHYDDPPRDVQRRVLADQLARIESCRAGGLDKPVVVHCRKAVEDLLPILRASTIPGDRFVFHCFTEVPDHARMVLDFGAMLSFTGVATYKNAPEVIESARLVPLDRIMVETDAPYLSPVPVRGTRPCEPAFAMHTARFLAEARGESWSVFHDAIDANTARFFGIDMARLADAQINGGGA